MPGIVTQGKPMRVPVIQPLVIVVKRQRCEKRVIETTYRVYSSLKIYAGLVLAADNIVIEVVIKATNNTAILPKIKVINPTGI
jgi:hypothetical protein